MSGRTKSGVALVAACAALACFGCGKEPETTRLDPPEDAVEAVEIQSDASSADRENPPSPTKDAANDSSSAIMPAIEPAGAEANNTDPIETSETIGAEVASEPKDASGVESGEDSIDGAASAEPPSVASDAIDAFRMYLPTTAGPLIVDAEIRIGDQPLTTSFRRRVESVMEEAAGGSDLTWRALFRHVASDPDAFGTMPINEGQYQNLIRMHDRNRNKQPEFDEVSKFLFRSARLAGPFRLVGTDFFRGINRAQSAVFKSLDRDGDHLLDADEISIARESLGRLDHNGDDRIDVAEVSADAQDDNRAWGLRRASRRGEVAMDLTGYVDWQMLAYALDESPRGGVFGQPRNVIARIDQDGDDSIDAEEARTVLSTEADVTLRVVYPVVAAGQSPRVEIVAAAPQLAPEIAQHEGAGSISISGDGLRLIAIASDLRSGRNRIPPQAFTALDANQDGGLDESEIPTPALREYSFEDLDVDGDGKLTMKEINEGMNPKSPIWTVQVRARGAEAPDGVFAWLDENQDRTISTRELDRLENRLRTLASDGTVTSAQIPDTFVLQFGRGDPNRDAELYASSPSRRPVVAASSWPGWAQSMDVNRDGDISRDEFPGTRQQFADLDVNRDGFLDGTEVR